jgi:dTDP-4-amino-4,6-dideoxygalactose transaminase
LTVVLITPEEFGVDPSTIFRTYGASREEVRLALEAENIEARPVWKPMHMQPVFDTQGAERIEHSEMSRPKARQNKKRYEARVVGGEVAEDLFERGLCLPSGTAMTNSDLDRVIDTILNSRKKAQKTQEG